MGWKVVGSGKVGKINDADGNGGPSEEKDIWREWDDKDQVSEDVKAKRSATDEYEILRGDFVGDILCSHSIRPELDQRRGS
jgi:hypothetical protein